MNGEQSFITPLNGGFSSIDPMVLGLLGEVNKTSKLLNFDIRNEQLVTRGGLQSSHTFPTGANKPFGYFVYHADSGQHWELLFALDGASTPRAWARASGQSWVQLTTSDAASIPNAKPDICTFCGVCVIAMPGRKLYTFDGGSELNAQDQPAGGARFLAKVGYRLFAAGSPEGRTIHFTEPNELVWEYSEEYDEDDNPVDLIPNHVQIQSDSPVTSIGEFNGTLIIFTENRLHEWVWTDRPDEGEIRELPYNVGSISHWATRVYNGKLLFAWYDGIYSWNGAVVKKESVDLDDYIETFETGPLRFQYWGSDADWSGWLHYHQEISDEEGHEGEMVIEKTDKTVQTCDPFETDDQEYSVAQAIVTQSFKVGQLMVGFKSIEAKLHWKVFGLGGPPWVRCRLYTYIGRQIHLWTGKYELTGYDTVKTETVKFTEEWRNPDYAHLFTNFHPSYTLWLKIDSNIGSAGTAGGYCFWRAKSGNPYGDGQSSENSAHDQMFKFNYEGSYNSGYSNSAPFHAHDMTTWGIFEAHIAEQPTGSTITFKYRHASSESGLTSASWNTISPGDTIGAGTNKWVQWRIELGMGTDGETPRIAGIRINWQTGAEDPAKLCDSWIFDNRYFATWKDGSNFIALVLDEKQRWRIWDWDLKEGDVAQGTLYGITGTEVIKYNTALTSDFGVPFVVEVWTVKWTFGNPFTDKQYRKALFGVEATQIDSLKIATENGEEELTNLAVTKAWLQESLEQDILGREAMMKLKGKSDEITKVRAMGLLYYEHGTR